MSRSRLLSGSVAAALAASTLTLAMPAAHAANTWGTVGEVYAATDSTPNVSGVSMDGDGKKVVYALSTDGGNTNTVQYSEFTGTSWSSGVPITPAGNYVNDATIALEADVVSFRESQGSGSLDVGAYVVRNDGGWQTPELVNTTTTTPTSIGSLSISADGNTTAYVVNQTGDQEIYASKYNGSTWVQSPKLNPNTNGSYPAVSADGNSVVYQDYNGSDDLIYVVTWDGSAWSSPLVVSDPTTDAASEPPMISEDGSVVIWENDDTSPDSLQANRKSGGTWGTPVTISDPIDEVEEYDLSLDGDTIVWQQEDPSLDRVYLSKFSGGSWGEAQIVTPDGERSEIPSVNRNGTQIVYRHDNVLYGIRELDGVWSSPELIQTGDTSGANYMSISPSGAVVSWLTQTPEPDYFAVVLATVSPEPGPPSSVVAVGGNKEATVTFAPGFVGALPTTSFVVQAYLNGEAVSGRTCAVTAPFSEPLSCKVTGLTPGQTYTFRVVGMNDNGSSDPSSQSNAVTISEASDVSAVRKMKVTGAGKKSFIKTTWKVPTAGTVSGYRIKYRLAKTSKVVYKRDLPAAQTKFTLKRKALLAATFRNRGDVAQLRYVVTVKPLSSSGNGPGTSRRFVLRF